MGRYFEVALFDPDDFKPESLYIPPSVDCRASFAVRDERKPHPNAVALYQRLKALNDLRNAPFYEGIVMKRLNFTYKQNARPDHENAEWVKHRWEF